MKNDYPMFEPGVSLTGVVTDWRDAEISGLVQRFGVWVSESGPSSWRQQEYLSPCLKDRMLKSSHIMHAGRQHNNFPKFQSSMSTIDSGL